MQLNPTAQTDDPSAGEIAALAYQIWEQEGRPQGRDLEHWAKAEAQLKAARRQTLSSSSKEQLAFLRSGGSGHFLRAQRRGVVQKGRARRVQPAAR
ncbi:MAG: DUF2934 domain-containing protein [Verrucomicrobia bacterium]|nr:DUF2934 domain-containing protein [Verrucomicrobiota bacterium]